MRLILILFVLVKWIVLLPFYIIRIPFLYYQDKKFLKNLKVGDSCYYHKEKHIVEYISKDRKRVRIKCRDIHGDYTHGNIPIDSISKFNF